MFGLPKRPKHYIRKMRRYVRAKSLLYIEWDNWYVGVTNDIPKRLAAHRRRYGRDFAVVAHWTTASAQHAAAIEKHFLQLGMNGAGGGWTSNSVHVYLIKISGPWSQIA